MGNYYFDRSDCYSPSPSWGFGFSKMSSLHVEEMHAFLLGLAMTSKRLTSHACRPETVPFLVLNVIENVTEAAAVAGETCWYAVLVETCGAGVSSRVSQVAEIFFCMAVETDVVLQGCLVFFGEAT
jgi:hypothetical protein